MPKATHAGATYYGYEGTVVDARDRVSELDPSRNVDGSVVDGFESDERTIEDRQAGDYPASTRVGEALSLEPPTPQEDEQDEREQQEEEEQAPDSSDERKPANVSPLVSTKKAPAARTSRSTAKK